MDRVNNEVLDTSVDLTSWFFLSKYFTILDDGRGGTRTSRAGLICSAGKLSSLGPCLFLGQGLPESSCYQGHKQKAVVEKCWQQQAQKPNEWKDLV